MAATKNKILSAAILIVLAVAYYYVENKPQSSATSETITAETHQTVLDYFNRQVSGKMITLDAEVTKVLSDDTHRPRHQRFIIKLNNNLTVLISHNIDLAPRVSGLKNGDRVTVTGQYEWNEKGGVIHWTHHDPQGRRDGGHIIHKGNTYR